MIDVKKVARLARLSLTADEEKLYQEQLKDVIEHFQQLEEVDTSGIDALVSPVLQAGPLRKDKVKNELDREAAMSSAPELVGQLFRVPPVV